MGLTANQLLEEARRSVREITPGEAKERIERGEFDLILDVREPAEWQEGHLPGAVHAPRGLLEWFADPGTKYAKQEIVSHREGRILVHCASGGRSLLAAQVLQQMGYRDVASMSGGFVEWAKMGNPVGKS